MKQRRKKRRDEPRPVLALGLVFAMTLATYLRSIDFDFTYDDHHHYVRNVFLADLGNLRQMLPWRYLALEIPDQGRPVLLLSHFLDRALGGSAAICHLQSALWHALCALLVTAFARRLGLTLLAATFAGLVFGLHPIQVEAVAGISNREDVLAATFGIATLLFAERALSNGGRAFIGMTVAFALALFAKEVALVVPALIVLGASLFPALRPPAARAKRAWTTLGATLGVVLLIWGAFQLRLGAPSLTFGAGGTGLERVELRVPAPPVFAVAAFAEPLAEPATPRRPQGQPRPTAALAFEAFRAWQLLVPYPSYVEYDTRPFQQPLAAVLGACVLALIAFGAARDRNRSRRFTWAAAWFALTTLPVSIPGLLLNPLADRFNYFPLVGFAVFAGFSLGETLPSRFGQKVVAYWAMLALGAVYFLRTSTSLMIWKDDVTLFTYAAQHAPDSPRVHLNLGSALAKSGRTKEARTSLERARELDPTLTAADYNLGILAESERRVVDAEESYRRAVSGRPIVAEAELRVRACARLGRLLAGQNRSKELAELAGIEREKTDDSRCAQALESGAAPGY